MVLKKRTMLLAEKMKFPVPFFLLADNGYFSLVGGSTLILSVQKKIHCPTIEATAWQWWRPHMSLVHILLRHK